MVALVVIYVSRDLQRLIRLRNRADEGFSDIDVQLKRRHDLIPNLVETVKGYAQHERQVFENVTAAAQRGRRRQGPAGAGPAESALTGALRQLFAVAETYPDLKANQNFLELQNEITDTEDKIQAARRFYNMTVRDLNIKIESFPSSVIAAGVASSASDRSSSSTSRPTARCRQSRSAPAPAAAPSRHPSGGPEGRVRVQADHLEQAQVDGAAVRLPAALRALGWLLSLWFGHCAFSHRDRRSDRDAHHQPVHGRRPGRARQRRAARSSARRTRPSCGVAVENLAITAGLPMPRLYIVDDDALRMRSRRGATRSRRSSASRSGLLARLDEEELEGVLAHELSHIRNYDVRLMTWAAVLAGSIALLANIFLRGLVFGGGRDEQWRATCSC